MGPARQAKGCFLRGSQETSRFDLFLGGTANPEGGCQQTDKAEARRAAGAQASFPSRRACEKTVPEKVPGKLQVCNFRTSRNCLAEIKSEIGKMMETG